MKLLGASRTREVKDWRDCWKSNYFIGNDPGVASGSGEYCRCVTARSTRVWTWFNYGNQRELEYDFILAPGADRSRFVSRFKCQQTVGRCGRQCGSTL